MAGHPGDLGRFIPLPHHRPKKSPSQGGHCLHQQVRYCNVSAEVQLMLLPTEAEPKFHLQVSIGWEAFWRFRMKRLAERPSTRKFGNPLDISGDLGKFIPLCQCPTFSNFCFRQWRCRRMRYYRRQVCNGTDQVHRQSTNFYCRKRSGLQQHAENSAPRTKKFRHSQVLGCG